MRFFFRSKKFKIILAVTAGVLVLTILGVFLGSSFSAQNSVVGTVTNTVQGIINKGAEKIDEISGKVGENEDLMRDNALLKSKINELTEKLMDYEQYKQENEFYKKYLEIKDNHSDYVLEPATLISRNADDPYGSFIINKGTVNGIKKRDPVITDAGLVGYISEVYPSYSKICTVLDFQMHCGGLDKRTRDVGVISGELPLAEKSRTKLKDLLRSSGIATGDYITTSGGGVFPEGLLIGTVESVHNQEYSEGLYAVVEPAVDFAELRDMMVITYFSGQGTAEENK